MRPLKEPCKHGAKYKKMKLLVFKIVAMVVVIVFGFWVADTLIGIQNEVRRGSGGDFGELRNLSSDINALYSLTRDIRDDVDNLVSDVEGLELDVSSLPLKIRCW